MTPRIRRVSRAGVHCGDFSSCVELRLTHGSKRTNSLRVPDFEHLAQNVSGFFPPSRIWKLALTRHHLAATPSPSSSSCSACPRPALLTPTTLRPSRPQLLPSPTRTPPSSCLSHAIPLSSHQAASPGHTLIHPNPSPTALATLAAPWSTPPRSVQEAASRLRMTAARRPRRGISISSRSCRPQASPMASTGRRSQPSHPAPPQGSSRCWRTTLVRSRRRRWTASQAST